MQMEGETLIFTFKRTCWTAYDVYYGTRTSNAEDQQRLNRVVNKFEGIAYYTQAPICITLSKRSLYVAERI